MILSVPREQNKFPEKIQSINPTLTKPRGMTLGDDHDKYSFKFDLVCACCNILCFEDKGKSVDKGSVSCSKG